MKIKEENDAIIPGREWGLLFIDMNWIYKGMLTNRLRINPNYTGYTDRLTLCLRVYACALDLSSALWSSVLRS